MKLYLIENKTDAIQVRQLLQLSADCASFRWNRNLKSKPENVSRALDIIEDYVSNLIDDYCNKGELYAEIDETEEKSMIISFKCSQILKKTLGTGVVLADEYIVVKQELEKFSELKTINEVLSEGKNLLIL